MIPSQEELDKQIGKTGEDLLNDDWTCYGWNFMDMEFNMDHDLFTFVVTFDGSMENTDADDDVLKPLVVTSVKYAGLGDMINIETGEVE